MSEALSPVPAKKPTSLALTTVEDVYRVAQAFANSGYFTDAADATQAFTKILAGRELGIPPIAAMKDVYIVKGRVTLSARVVASLVKASGKYDYRVKARTNKECSIEFLQRDPDAKKWESLGVSTFTMDMAKTAGLTKNPTWTSFPENMLFARAMTNGVGTYCPDVTHGTVYAPDELSDEFGVDSDGNTVRYEKAAPAPWATVARVLVESTPVPGDPMAADKQALIEQVYLAAKAARFPEDKFDEWLRRHGAPSLDAVPNDGLRTLLAQLREKAELAKV